MYAAIASTGGIRAAGRTQWLTDTCRYRSYTGDDINDTSVVERCLILPSLPKVGVVDLAQALRVVCGLWAPSDDCWHVDINLSIVDQHAVELSDHAYAAAMGLTVMTLQDFAKS